MSDRDTDSRPTARRAQAPARFLPRLRVSCLYCGERIPARKGDQVYCSKTCLIADLNEAGGVGD